MNWQLVTNFAIALLAIANPIGKVPLWIETSKYDGFRVQWRLAVLVTVTGFAILATFLLLGSQILDLFGIDLASFRVGGGIVILLIGIDMLNGNVTQVEVEEKEEDISPMQRAQQRIRQFVVPLVLPMIAGPGTISTVVIYGSRASSMLDYALLISVLTGVMLLILGTLVSSHKIKEVVGQMAITLLTRLFGLILVAIAMQLIVEGLGNIFPAWVTPASDISDSVNQQNG
jgi:multiple antibiotic resistance protein